MVASYHGQGECLAVLIEAGADLEAKSQTGDTPISFAAMYGHSQCLVRLAEAGARLDTVNNARRSPLDLANARGHHDCADMIRCLVERASIQRDCKPAKRPRKPTAARL